LRLGGYTLQALREREAPPRRRRLTEEDRRRRREEPFGRRGGEAGAKRNVSVRIACASLGVPTYFASGRAQGVSMREFAAASARLQVLDALPAGATREQRRAALDKVADAFKCAGADGLKRHFVDAHPKKGKRSLAAQHEHDEAYLRLGGHTLQTLREREAAPRRRRLTEEDRRRRREELFPELVGRGPPAEARNAFDQTCIDLRLESAPEALRAAMVRGRVAANAFDPSLLSGFLEARRRRPIAALPASAPQPVCMGAAPPVGAVAAPPVSAVAAPPVGAVVARPFGMGAATADARVPFGGALQELDAAVEVDAALVAPALDGALAAPAWPTPPPAAALDASAQLFGLDLDARSRQAAAPAPVVAAPALVSPVAAAASTKRPRDESPKSVAQSCVESYQ